MIKQLIYGITTAAVLTGCTTTLNVVSVPDNAKVSLIKSGNSALTNSEIKLDKEFFHGKDSKLEEVCFYKEGYRTKCIQQNIKKSAKNNVSVNLDELNTSITFNSNPQGAIVRLNTNQTLLPKDWKQEFKTPKTFKATKKEAEQLSNLGIDKVEYEGYIAKGVNKYKSNILEPAANKSVVINLEPITTTIRIMTEPEGSTVEDITQGGFGYLGETPIVRNLTWKDIVNWAERKEVKRASGNNFDSIELNLRISKPGYQDVIMQSLRVPVGEERTFKRGLKKLIKEVSFSSDPAGVHVYVDRQVMQEYYDAKLGKVVTKSVPFQKHLGTTPVTYNIDHTQPLKHGDTLIFKKSGYKDATIPYALGQESFHIVLEPKVIKAR